MFIYILVGPLPYVAGHVHRAERTGTGRMRVHIRRTGHVAALVGLGNGALVPGWPPRIQPPILALRRVLPFPFVRQPLARPCRISPRILQRYPGYRLVPPTVRVAALPPIF